MKFFRMFQRVVGHAVRVDPQSVLKSVRPYLIEGERIGMAFKQVRDHIVFTQHRMIIVDIRTIGVQRSIKSIPYQSIQRFEIITSGAVDLNTELLIWVNFSRDPTFVILFANNDDNLLTLQRLLSTAILLED